MWFGSKRVTPLCTIFFALQATGCTHTTLIRVKQPQAAIAVNGEHLGTGAVKAEVPNGFGHYDLEVKEASRTALHAMIDRDVYSQPPVRTGLLLGFAGALVGPIFGALAGFVCGSAIGVVYSTIAHAPSGIGWPGMLDSIAAPQAIGMLVGVPVGLLGATGAAAAWTVLNLQRGPEEIEIDLERKELATRPAVHFTVVATEEQARINTPQPIEHPAVPPPLPAPSTTLPVDDGAAN